MKTKTFIPLLVIAAGLLAYHNSFQGPFIFDDVSIPANPHIRHLWPIREALSAPPDSAVNGRPVVCLTLALNYALGGLNVWGYHAFNLTVHLVAALVLFGIMRRTFEVGKLRDRFGSAAIWLAAAIALIWEVHPLQTESVTYIGQRTESLMGLFLLLTVYCTLRSSQSSHSSVWCLAAVVSCALGMGSKEVMVGAPLIVLLYDRVFLASSFRELWQRRIGLYVGLAATWLILAGVMASTPRPMGWCAMEGLTPWDYLKTEAGVIVYYLRLCFWPRPLVVDYYDWPITSLLKDGLVSGVVVVGLLCATVWAFRRRPWAGFLGAWFFLILGPTSSVLPIFGEVAAERRMYLPLAAVTALVVTTGYEGLAWAARHVGATEKQRRYVMCGLVGVIVVALGWLTVLRNKDYRSEVALWSDTVAKRPQNARAHNNLGVYLVRMGRLQDAIRHYEIALRLEPDYAEAHNNLGLALCQTGKVQEAIRHYEIALRLKPDDAEVHSNLGNALDQAGRTQDAIAQYQLALQINPGYAEAHNNLGVALEKIGKVKDALGHFEQALRIRPEFNEAHFNMGNALMQVGRLRDAVEHYEQAVRIKPDNAEAQNNLGGVLLQLGRSQEAIGHFEQVLRLMPDNADAHFNMGNALFGLGKVPEAAAQYEQALRLKPDFAEAKTSLARLRAVQ